MLILNIKDLMLSKKIPVLLLKSMLFQFPKSFLHICKQGANFYLYKLSHSRKRSNIHLQPSL